MTHMDEVEVVRQITEDHPLFAEDRPTFKAKFPKSSNKTTMQCRCNLTSLLLLLTFKCSKCLKALPNNRTKTNNTSLLPTAWFTQVAKKSHCQARCSWIRIYSRLGRKPMPGRWLRKTRKDSSRWTCKDKWKKSRLKKRQMRAKRKKKKQERKTDFRENESSWKKPIERRKSPSAKKSKTLGTLTNRWLTTKKHLSL